MTHPFIDTTESPDLAPDPVRSGPAAAAYAAAIAATVGAGAARAASITDAQAARFLTQASMGASRDQIVRVQQLGYAGWLDEQLAMAPSRSRWDWLLDAGYDDVALKNSQAGFNAATWSKLIASPDTLRQRITLALSEILVVSVDGLAGAGWKGFAAAAYLDLLEEHAFGSYRELLGAVSTSVAMGVYLTFRGNVKYRPRTGALPDENYAREIMQLFSIGLVQLNADGTPIEDADGPVESYGQDDIAGLARVFTGWDFDLSSSDKSTPDYVRRPMLQIDSRHEFGEKTFLGYTIPAGVDGQTSLNLALDTLCAHPNMAPFICRQLIQKLVTSNPSPAYVARVASVFISDGSGRRGELRSVILAILLDSEARQDSQLAAVDFGKLREPILRFTAWARAFRASSPAGTWNIGDTSDPASKLGQSPLRSPSVFNFFRPGYVPPNSGIAESELVAPEFQITNESTVIGYVNFMQKAVSIGVGNVKANYNALLPYATNAPSLVNELNIVLAAGQLSASTQALLTSALNTMPANNQTARLKRIYAAVVLVLAAPEFIVQK